MAKLVELNQYLIREKFWKFFGNKFRIMDDQENLYGFCEQKRFKLKEDLRVYDDEDKNNEWLVIKQKNIVDSWGGFDIFDPRTSEHLGTIRRKFWKSLFRTKLIRDITSSILISPSSFKSPSSDTNLYIYSVPQNNSSLC